MNDYLQAVLMILLTVVLYYGSKRLQDKYKNPFLNPTDSFNRDNSCIIGFGVSYKGYMKGGNWINHVLNATVVCLVYPLYENRQKIKQYISVIFAC